MDFGGKMNIWVDLGHIPQYNFYKPLILRLAKEGKCVYVTYLNRGRMPKIIQAELGQVENVHLYQIGKHRMSRLSVILEANLLRNVQLFIWKLGKHIDVVLSNGYQAAFIGWLFGVPSYSYDDDPQTIHYRPKVLLNKSCNYCIYKYQGKKLSSKAHILPVLKEWAYLSPSVFIPNINVLNKYGIKPREYFFLREVSVGTMNYIGQKAQAIYAIKDIIPQSKKVLFSLEEKAKRDMYPKEWQLLQEPIDDVHSLIYYSCGLISSGDSMAREASMLGVPSLYLGIRNDMPANKAAIEVANMYSNDMIDIKQWLNDCLVPTEELNKQQEIIREKVFNSFIDISEYIYNEIFK